MKKRLGVCLLLCLLIGCSGAELEERCFPQVVAVGYADGEVLYGMGFPRVGSSGQKDSQLKEIQVPIVKEKSFEESKLVYESHLNQDADYNHLKVLVMEESFLDEKSAYMEMLDVLAQTEDFPRNTYVCVVSDVEALMEMEENLPQDIGTYLEAYLDNHELNKGYMMTLGDLMDEKENEKMVIYLPFLKVEENYVEWEGYYPVENDK